MDADIIRRLLRSATIIAWAAVLGFLIYAATPASQTWRSTDTEWLLFVLIWLALVTIAVFVTCSWFGTEVFAHSAARYAAAQPSVDVIAAQAVLAVLRELEQQGRDVPPVDAIVAEAVLAVLRELERRDLPSITDRRRDR